jgi:hypothetical protein
MNPKKKLRRYRVSVSIHALDLAIYHFTYSFALGPYGGSPWTHVGLQWSRGSLSWSRGGHPGALETRPGALESHSRAMEAHPGAVERLHA